MDTTQGKPRHLASWNYDQGACYHVVICTDFKRKLFGEVVDGPTTNDEPKGQPAESRFTVALNALGEACRQSVLDVERASLGIEVPIFVVMPNHVHLLVLTDEHEAKMPLGRFVSWIKSSTTRASRKLGHTGPVWQENYYEHIIRDDEDYRRVFEYINDNPAKWATDEYHCD